MAPFFGMPIVVKFGQFKKNPKKLEETGNGKNPIFSPNPSKLGLVNKLGNVNRLLLHTLYHNTTQLTVVNRHMTKITRKH